MTHTLSCALPHQRSPNKVRYVRLRHLSEFLVNVHQQGEKIYCSEMLKGRFGGVDVVPLGVPLLCPDLGMTTMAILGIVEDEDICATAA